MTTASILLQELLNSPASAPPFGVHPNFVNPSNLKVEFYITFVSCVTISMIAVGMRIWTQIRLNHKSFMEDWICCLALTIFLTFCAIALVFRKHHHGVHQWDLKLIDFSGFLYWYRMDAIIYGFVIFFIKLAILLQCRRIFVPLKTRNAMFWTCHGLIWVNFIFYLVCTLLWIFPCKPIKKTWNPWIDGRCIAIHRVDITTSAINTVSDFSILVLLQYIIWNLQMPSRKKIGISAIFLIGVLACASSAVRLYYATKLTHSKDLTYDISVMGLWAGPEMAAGILAICLPVSPKFFQALKASKLGTFLQSLFRGISETNLNLDESKTAKGHLNASFRKYRFLSDQISTSKDDNSEQDTPNQHSLGELLTIQILRTTEIVTTSDRGSMANPRNGVYNV